MSLPQSVEPALEFVIGRDPCGHWLAIETHGLAGGFFSSVDEALRYVSTDFHEQKKRIEFVDTFIEPFGKTCIEIAGRYRHSTGPHPKRGSAGPVRKRTAVSAAS